jgi:hypothetical protein
MNDPETLTFKRFKMPFREKPIYSATNPLIRFNFARNPLLANPVIQRGLSSVDQQSQNLVKEEPVSITNNGKPIVGGSRDIKSIPLMKVRASKKTN